MTLPSSMDLAPVALFPPLPEEELTVELGERRMTMAAGVKRPLLAAPYDDASREVSVCRTDSTCSTTTDTSPSIAQRALTMIARLARPRDIRRLSAW